ncbi:MFS transporter [Lignipirellula cremea]|uniref:Major Facilitator Superfamily protein n=1 Tax=Lignipirellula cremea TaxID=2528010 RepID=A0A518DU83_9BACT|nr:MFS transporter [Lignipirellula cremea]QDU95400.1 Major Facilitator Superfamily protein [Lignipirellula cremea]
MSNGQNKAIFWASFCTLIAAGMGFAIRGAILNDWANQYGFTKTDLGTITGGGLVGFGVIIILSSFIVDKVGYKPLMLIAFVLHVLSALITLAATPVFVAAGKDATYWCLYIGMFMFAIANGLCEAVINPLTATLFPHKKTHYLNILHAGWPGGLILGGILAFLFCGVGAKISHLQWEIPMLLFLIPTALYGFVVVREKFPESEATAAGVSVGQMLAEFAAPILLFLFVLHAMVGYVELGTDSWITNIIENVTAEYAILLFIYTSSIMFVLRFFAGPIVEHINPIGLLLISSILGCIGLLLLGNSTLMPMLILAATIYGVGKTFLWPTMLGVVGERYPKGGAMTMGVMGGIGMLSAGLLGGPGIGYNQDFFASKELAAKSEPTFERYQNAKESGFLFFPKIHGLDGSKVGVVSDNGQQLAVDLKRAEEGEESKELQALNAWWQSAKEFEKTDKPLVQEAGLFGGQMALVWTALVPAMMAVGYLLLFIYFQATGGYHAVDLAREKELEEGDPKHRGEKYTGGVEGPVK